MTKKNKDRCVSLRVPFTEDEHRLLKLACVRRGLKMGAWVRDLVMAALKGRP